MSNVYAIFTLITAGLYVLMQALTYSNNSTPTNEVQVHNNEAQGGSKTKSRRKYRMKTKSSKKR